MVGMGGAVGAVEAINGVASIALIGVLVERAFGELEVVFGDDLVQGVFTTTDDLAGGAVAEDVFLFRDSGSPRSLPTMALTLVSRHFWERG